MIDNKVDNNDDNYEMDSNDITTNDNNNNNNNYRNNHNDDYIFKGEIIKKQIINLYKTTREHI